MQPISILNPRAVPVQWLIAAAVFAGFIMSIAIRPLEAAPTIGLTPVVGGLDRPVAITHADDGSGRLFITLQSGLIVIHDGLQLLPVPFLDIRPLVSTGAEQGLLSLAFHPNYADNGLLYVNYTNQLGTTVVARYTVSVDPNRVDPGSAIVLLSVAQPFANHNGGQLHFGPDGFLYIGMGDGGSAGDPLDQAQSLTSLLGKMLRIDVDADLPYGLPSDNPFIGDPGVREEIWALGLRNPWRFSFDRLTGDLWIADVGQNRLEEINLQAARSGGGENYGWRRMEADNCYLPAANCNDGTLVLPLLQYDHTLGCSVTGGYRYRGLQHPDLEGIYFYGDFCSGRIWGASQDLDGAWITEELLDTGLSISAFGEDEEGEIYVAHLARGAGELFRIDAVASPEPPDDDTDGDAGGEGGCFVASVSQ